MPATKPLITEPSINVRVRKTNAHFTRVREKGGVEFGAGKFFLLIDITAIRQDIYIPVSITSSKKPTGFIYEIVGTREGEISTTDISCEGKEISQITLGTILYCKIPATKTGTFRIIVETRGKLGGVFRIVINRINYKLDPSDARYGKLMADFSSESVKFS